MSAETAWVVCGVLGYLMILFVTLAALACFGLDAPEAVLCALFWPLTAMAGLGLWIYSGLVALYNHMGAWRRPKTPG